MMTITLHWYHLPLFCLIGFLYFARAASKARGGMFTPGGTTESVIAAACLLAAIVSAVAGAWARYSS